MKIFYSFGVDQKTYDLIARLCPTYAAKDPTDMVIRAISLANIIAEYVGDGHDLILSCPDSAKKPRTLHLDK